MLTALLVACGSSAWAAGPPLSLVDIGGGGEVKGGPPADKPLAPYRSGRGIYAPTGQGFVSEVEPNNTAATATPLGGTNVVVRANIFPNGDIDFFSFTAGAGDRVYAATMTSFSANASSDSQLDVIASDGTTSLEFDDDDGSLGGLSSSIAGVTIPSAGTYYLRVKHFSATNQLRPYDLHLRVQSGTPTAEVEPNNTPATATPLPASGWVSGSVNPAADADFFSLTLAAGDTVYLSLDMNPERDATTWNGRLGLALFGTALNQILVVNDASTTSPNSEAFFFTVKDAGTYFAYVDEPAAGGGAAFTYHLSVSVHPNTAATANCTTYTSTDVPQTIPTGPGQVNSTIVVPGSHRIADLDLRVQLNHTNMPDLDVHLISPQGNDNGVFTDIGAAAQTAMDTLFDDEAGIPAGVFTVVSPTGFQPELAYRLGWYDGEDAGGTWTLAIRDDTAANGGTLTAWSLTVCEPPPPPACPPGFGVTTVYTNDFEAGTGGFTHSGTQDEWARGLPTFAPITTCNSGSNCWKTDLANTYNASSNQDLLSPNINLAGLVAPVTVTWAQRYQMENTSFDHYSVDIRQVGVPTNAQRLYEWLDATMTDTVGNPTVTLNESAGWGTFSKQADSFAGLNTELVFHLDSDTTVQLAGAAVDDVTVTACRQLMADLSITKTDGVTTAVPGGSVTYTITASNAGPDAANPATVADTFPAILTCTWTCVGAGGGTCTASGSGNINDATVNLPSGGSVTYTASCTISASATGSLSNTATVSSSITDPVPGNNSATDTDTLTPMADLSITKTDGVTSVVPGTSTTYTITASNAGPSNAPGSTVADTFPANCGSVTWTCTGAGGGTCTASGSGNINQTVNLPVGGSVTFSAVCSVPAAATGSLTNTATVTSGTGVTDPTPGNNSATDSDTLTPMGDLSITKTDGLTTATPGQATTYTIVVTNPGPSNGVGLFVSDTFPAAFTSPTWTCAGAGGGTCTASGSGNISDTVNLPAGATVTYTVNGTISNAFTGTLSNTATVAVSPPSPPNGNPPGFTDPNLANNTATDNTDVVAAPPVVSGTKAVAGDFRPGGAITYTVVLSNTGTGAQADNPGNEFTDVLPAQLTLVSASATSGTAVATVATNTVTWNGSIPAGGSVTITIQATINADASGTVTNQGTVSYDADGNGTNEATALTDDPSVGGNQDPTDLVVGINPLAIPTLSSWGLAAMALLMAGLAVVALARRRRA
ncbi:MAG: IPTL-CTERM sorting domain-containing protein [Thermoanaerobaculia bacterium]